VDRRSHPDKHWRFVTEAITIVFAKSWVDYPGYEIHFRKNADDGKSVIIHVYMKKYEVRMIFGRKWWSRW